MAYKDRRRKNKYQRSWKAQRRRAWIAAQGGFCKWCGSTEDLQVDHIDPDLKTCNPTDVWCLSQEKRERELANCQVLCQECNLAKRDADAAREAVPF